MSAMAHTAAPWTARAFSSIVGCPVTAQPDSTKNSFNVGSAHGSQFDSYEERRAEIEANARLFAAGPELLAIADELEAAIDEQTYSQRRAADFDQPDDAELTVNITAKQFRALSAAIAKATGAA